MLEYPQSIFLTPQRSHFFMVQGGLEWLLKPHGKLFG
jgi:hypothetical protein